MLFTTLSFFIFFAGVYAVNWSIRGKPREIFLIAASLVFYAAWSIPFALHFLFMVLLNFYFIKLILKKRDKKILLTITAINAANLFFFKYFYLFLQTLHLMSGGNGIFARDIFNGWLFQNFQLPEIVLPLAISFYTFQLIAFTVDSYRGKIDEDISLARFVLFILFFPQLVAGPIMRHSDFFPQLDGIRPDRDKTLAGIFLLLMGFLKKTVLADNMMPLYHDIYSNPETFDWRSNLLASAAFAIHVYCDFSGYTDIARGLGKLLGFDLPENFSGPYLARSQQDLWRRWHITLSSWLRDYIFIPLGGSRGSEFRTNINLIITFTLGGLWHGANYTYIAWGAFHGILISLERSLQGFPLFRKINGARSEKWGFFISSFQTFATFSFFLVGCIFFNSSDLTHSLQMFSQILSFAGGTLTPHAENILLLLIPLFLLNYLQTQERFTAFSPRSRYILASVSLFLLIAIMGKFAPSGNEFIYFQF